MAIRNRSKPSQLDQEAHDLLQALIETPPLPTEQRWAPIALRSAHEQRRHALQGFLLRTWFDALLHRAERVVIFALVLVFGYWLIDGPVRDWIHDWQTPAANASASIPTLAAPNNQLLESDPPQRRSPVHHSQHICSFQQSRSIRRSKRSSWSMALGKWPTTLRDICTALECRAKRVILCWPGTLACAAPSFAILDRWLPAMIYLSTRRAGAIAIASASPKVYLRHRSKCLTQPQTQH